ncbi:MAG: hypothetical protein QMC28_03315 [Flavobacteriales bacterium]
MMERSFSVYNKYFKSLALNNFSTSDQQVETVVISDSFSQMTPDTNQVLANK